MPSLTVNQEKFRTLNQELEPLRLRLRRHVVYAHLHDVTDLKHFMSHHVFAVWDFMSLLKALQQAYCPDQVPWVPPENRLAARLVNEIVLAEETDEGPDGESISHFEMYRQAMIQMSASTRLIDQLLLAIRQGKSIEACLVEIPWPKHVGDFVAQTFEFIDRGQPEELAAVFLFGREDLIPDMFKEIVANLNRELKGELSCFEYYLNRHIELDEEAHGPMAELLLTSLCGQDDEKWNRAGEAARKTLLQRISLWDGIAASIAGAKLVTV